MLLVSNGVKCPLNSVPPAGHSKRDGDVNKAQQLKGS